MHPTPLLRSAVRRALSLAALAAALAPTAASAQQTPASATAAQVNVRDSVKVTRTAYYVEVWSPTVDSHGRHYFRFDCSSGIVATWPDVLASLGLPGGYSRYSLVSTGGTAADYVPRGYGEARTNPDYNIVVPAGFLGHNPQLGGGINQPVYPPNSPRMDGCAQVRAKAEAAAGGSWPSGLLNAGPFRINDWYAVFSVPSGTPIALFEWEDAGPLTLAFDASFASKQSHEVDAAAPGGKRPVASYRWAFGDGTTGTGERPTHVYADSGRYVVSLEVTDDDGERATVNRRVEVKKPGLVVWAEAREAGQTVSKDTPLYVVAHVENRSDAEIRNIRVPLDVGFGVDYPDSVKAVRLKTEPKYARLSHAGHNDTTIATLAPGATAEVLVTYKAASYATYKPGEIYLATEATSHAVLTGVVGEDAQGNPVNVKEKCGADPCGNTWKVAPGWNTRAELRTDDRVTFQAHSGVEYNPDLGAPELAAFNFERVQPFTFKFVDGTLTRFCHSACVDLRVVVTDALNGGAPVKDATVVVTAPTLPEGVGVTPDQGGGHVCVRNTASFSCAKTLTVRTNDEGEAPPMYYAFPGLAAPAEAELTFLFRDGSTNIAQETRTLRMLPTERTDFTRTITLGADEVTWLNNTLMAVIAGTVGNAAGELCEGYLKFLGGLDEKYSTIRPSTSSVMHRGRNLFAEWACTLNPYSIWGEGTSGNVKKIAETALITWFGSRFIPPDDALGMLNGPYPPPFVFYWDGDYYAAILNALQAAKPHLSADATMTLRLFEVSWLQKESVFNGQPMVPSAYFSLKTERYGSVEHNAIIELGYDAVRWQTPPSSVRLEILAQAEAERLRLQESLERMRRGDFLTLGAGTPTQETVQITGVSDASGTVAQREAGTLGTSGLRSGPYEVTLSRRLRFAHGPADSLVVTRDTFGVAPPMPPLRPSLDSVATTLPATLSWRIGAFETPETVDVQASRDTLFTTLVFEASGLDARTATSVASVRLADGERLYWRVRAANRVGVGAWSRAGLVVGSDVVGTAGADEGIAAAGVVTLSAPVPNPTSGRSSVAYALPVAGSVHLSVFDLLGREVAVLADGMQAAGRHAAALPTHQLSPGVYVVRLVAGAETRTVRLVVAR